MNSDIMESKTASTAKTTAVGSVVVKHSDLSNILWKIDNFGQLIANNDQSGSIESDVFSTKDGLKWRLRIFPNGFDNDPSSQQQKFVSIYLLFDDSNQQQTVKARFNFGVRNVNSNMNVLMIETPKTYSFFPGKDWGNRRFVAHDTLLENKEDLLAKGQLTLVCQLQLRLNDSDSKKSFKLTKNNTRTIDAARMIQQLQKESEKSAAEKDRRQALMKNPIGFSDTILLQSPAAKEIGVSHGLEAVRGSRLTKINWIIPNFSQKCAEALELSGQARHRFVLKSPEFAVGPDYENRWRLMVYPGSVDKEVAEYVSVYLFMMSAGGKQSEARVLFDFSIVDQTTHEDKHGMESSRVKSFSTGKDWGFKRFVLRSVMLDRNSGMLGKDGELSLTCQIRPDDPVPALTTSHATFVNKRITPTTGVAPAVAGTAQQVAAQMSMTLVRKHASTNQPVSEENKNAEKDRRQALVAVPLAFKEETVFETHSSAENQQPIAPAPTAPCEKEKVIEDDWDDRDECKPSSKKEIEETLKSLTHNQLGALHKMWGITSYPSVAMRKELTANKSIPDRHIQIWFLNQREYLRQLRAETRSEPAAVPMQSDMAPSTPTAKKPSISAAAPLTAETKTNASGKPDSNVSENRYRDEQTAALMNHANLIKQLEQNKRILRQQLDMLKTLTEMNDGSYSICVSETTSAAPERQAIDFMSIYELASETATAADEVFMYDTLLKSTSRSQAAQIPTFAADDPANGTATEQQKMAFGSDLLKTGSEIETSSPTENQQTHKCTVCDKKFSRPWLLQGHLRSHQIATWLSNQRAGQRELYTHEIQVLPKTGDAVADIGNTNENRNAEMGTASRSTVSAAVPIMSNKRGDLCGGALGNGSGEMRASKIPLMPDQLEALEKVFNNCRYPDVYGRERIAADVLATEGQIERWFRNRRAKWRQEVGYKARFDAESYGLYGGAMVKQTLADKSKVEAMALPSKIASKKRSSGIEASRWPEASLENATGKTSSSAAPIAETENIACEVKLSDGDVNGAAAKRNSNEKCGGGTETNVVSTLKIAAVPPLSMQEQIKELALEVKTLRTVRDMFDMAKANGVSSDSAMPTTLESFVSNHSTSQAVKMPMASSAHTAASETAADQLSNSSCPSLIAETEVSCSRASSFDLIANNNSAKSSECEWSSTISEKEETASQRESANGSPFVVADMQSEYSTGGCAGQREGSVETVANDDNLDSRVQTALSSAMSNISLNSATLVSPPSYTIDRASGRVRFSFTLRK